VGSENLGKGKNERRGIMTGRNKLTYWEPTQKLNPRKELERVALKKGLGQIGKQSLNLI